MVIGTAAGVVGMEDTMGEMVMKLSEQASVYWIAGQPALPTNL